MSALETMGEVHVHIEGGYCMLISTAPVSHAHRMTYMLDTDLVDRKPAMIGTALYIGYGGYSVHYSILSITDTRPFSFPYRNGADTQRIMIKSAGEPVEKIGCDILSRRIDFSKGLELIQVLVIPARSSTDVLTSTSTFQLWPCNLLHLPW
jgi:hypothetical protein